MSIIHKASNTTAVNPVAGDLEIAEIAINFRDKKIFTKDDLGAVLDLTNYISATNPSDKYIFTNTDSVTLVTDGAITIGATSGANLALDTNEVQARNNGNLSSLYLNKEGGQTFIGKTSADQLTVHGGSVFNGTYNNFGGDVTANSIIATSSGGLQWEHGRSRITHNDGAGNCQIRFGNKFLVTEVYTADASSAGRIRQDIDAEGQPLSFVASNDTGVLEGDTVNWGSILYVYADRITFGTTAISDSGTASNLRSSDSLLLNGAVSDSAITADTIVKRDGAANIKASAYESTLAQVASNTDTIFFSSDDTWIRKNTALGFRTSLDVHDKGSVADRLSRDDSINRSNRLLAASYDLDNLILGGEYMGSSLVNAPAGSGGWFFITVQRHNDTYQIQTAKSFTESPARVWVRSQINDVWNVWQAQVSATSSNVFNKPQLINAYLALTTTAVTPDMDAYSAFTFSFVGAVTVNNPTIVATDWMRRVRSGVIYISDVVTSLSWGTEYHFGDGVLPPGGEHGYVLFTVVDDTVVLCSYIRS